MMIKEKKNTMKRRDFIQLAALLSGGMATPSAYASIVDSLSPKQRQYLASNPDFIERAIRYFSPQQHKLVEALAQLVIPTTDTPGSDEAGVAKFIELMVGQWFKPKERTTFMGGLSFLEKQGFLQLDEGQQIDILERLESDASDEPWYELGNSIDGDFDSDAPFICQLKELSASGFFLSKVGATQVLRHIHIPGQFNGDVPLSVEDSSWAGGINSDS